MPMFRLKVVKDVTFVYEPEDIEAPTLADAKVIAEERARMGLLTATTDGWQIINVWEEPEEGE